MAKQPISSENLKEFKDHLVQVLLTCEGYRLPELGQFKPLYKKTFGREFKPGRYGIKTKKLGDIMKLVTDVVSLEPGASNSIQVILKESHIPLAAHSNATSLYDLNTSNPLVDIVNTTAHSFESDEYAALLQQSALGFDGVAVSSLDAVEEQSLLPPVVSAQFASPLLLQDLTGYRLPKLGQFRALYTTTFGRKFKPRHYGIETKNVEDAMKLVTDVVSLEPGPSNSLQLILKESHIPLAVHSSVTSLHDLNASNPLVDVVNATDHSLESDVDAALLQQNTLGLHGVGDGPGTATGIATPLMVPPPTIHGPIIAPPFSFPTLPPPQLCQNVTTGSACSSQVEQKGASGMSSKMPHSIREIMIEQAEEEKQSRKAPPSGDAGEGRVREVGEPGPFEMSFSEAQRIEASSANKKPARSATRAEVNKVTENIISSLSDEGNFVSLDLVKAKLCKEFGKSSIKDLGFRREADIPALQDLIKLQGEVTLFVHAYVMSNSISTLYELNQSVADLKSKPDFQDLKLGPLVKQPAVYDLFKAPPDLASITHITTIQILKHLENYMSEENLWRTKVKLENFLKYLCHQYDCDTPYNLGVRIRSMGLPISVIKKAKRVESERWKDAREKFSEEMKTEILTHLRKIKRELLGLEPGDFRSCIMKFCDSSPVHIIQEIFNCCMELFDGESQRQITKFLTMLTTNSHGRQLFQLALHMGCRRVIGIAPEEITASVQPKEENKSKDKTKKEMNPPSQGQVVDELRQWLDKAETLDLVTLARIESNIVKKFPGFSGFEAFGYGSFLNFLTKHKKLLEAIDEVGGMTRRGNEGAGTLGRRVSVNNILDFILQCGTRTPTEIVERNLCSYYGVNKVTDLGFGSCSRLLTKAEQRRKTKSDVSTHSVIYEAALLCRDATNDEGGYSSDQGHSGAVLGCKSKEEALAAISNTPLLEDVALWTHWDDVYGGKISDLGDLPSFVEKKRVPGSLGKSSVQTESNFVFMESSPGLLLKVTTDTSPEIFHQCASRADVLGTAGHLVSMVIINGGVSKTPVALLANHVRSSLASLASSEASADFVLGCLVRLPRRLAQAVGAKVLLEPLKELIGSTEVPELLISRCSTQAQRSRLHQLGFVLGVNHWIEDFQRRVSSKEEGHMKVETSQERKQDKPIGVVKPVTFPRDVVVQKEPVSEFENAEAAPTIDEGSAAVDGISCPTVDALPNLPEDSLSDVKKREESCRALIEQIRREDFGIGFVLGEEESKLVNKQREREGRGLHRLSTELYSRDTHFVLELVQNADDNRYSEECMSAGNPSLVFILECDKIIVLNNEEGFAEKNIRALCDVGRSTKGAHRYGYIGQKGIGFKSVFRVSDSPEVHSNGFHIRFDAKSGPMGYILPQWIGAIPEAEDTSSTQSDEGNEEIGAELEQCEMAPEAQISVTMDDEFEGWATRIVLPLKEEQQGSERRSLAARFRDIHPSLLLFLHRLRRITIQDKANNTCREMIRRDLGENIMEVSHASGTDRWLVVKKQLNSSQIKEDVEMSELALAFPLLGETSSDEHEATGRRQQILPQQNVFAYLPLRSYGFRFIIQGDFEVPSSREDVDTDKPWNQWLREQIPQLFVDSLGVFMNHPSFLGVSSLVAYFKFVPLEEEISDFFTPVARHILKLLQGTPCIPVFRAQNEEDHLRSRKGDTHSDSVEWVLPCKAIMFHDSTVQEVISPALLKEHLDLFYLHPRMASALNPTLRSRLGIETLSSKHLIEIGKAEIKKASERSDEGGNLSQGRKPAISRIPWVARWLQWMYRCLEQERDSSQEVLDTIGSLNVIPLTDGTFIHLKGDSLFFPLSLEKESEGSVRKKTASGKRLPERSNFNVLEKDLSTVHPNLFTSLDDIGRLQVEELLRRLGVKSWTPGELINSHILPTLKSDKWKVKSSEVMKSYLVYIHEQRLNDPSVCDLDELRSCVQILTNKGVYNPSETPIHFTPLYGNKIDLARDLTSISWTLIQDSYFKSTTHPHELTSFLAELGVKSFLAIKRKQVKLERSCMDQSPWASFVNIWPTTPDGVYLIDDWACEQFDEFLCNVVHSKNKKKVSPVESRVLAECIDERWDGEYAKYADGGVHYKDSKGQILGETRCSFYLNLVSKPWLSASQGREASSAKAEESFYQPKELFKKTNFVYDLLEDHVKYVIADLKNNAFVSTLLIRETVTLEGLLAEIIRWSSSVEQASERHQTNRFFTSISHMNKIYSFLWRRLGENVVDKGKICEAFRKNALLFIPDTPHDSRVAKGQQLAGRFHMKKEVCWRDPTGVSAKLFKENAKSFTRHLLEPSYSHCQPSLVGFFIDEMNVDETPNMDEYIEMASAVAEKARLPTPSSLEDMFKIFSILGRKCIARGQYDNFRTTIEIDENKSLYLKQRLEREERLIFPSHERWVALSDRPLIPDDKSLVKIFKNEKGIDFLDLDSFFRFPTGQSSSRMALEERRKMQENVSLFLRACMVMTVSECVEKQFTPDMVEYQCIPVQKYFHRMMSCVQRFLYFKMHNLYTELKSDCFAQKLAEMKFATVKGLETVYSLTSHPEVHIPIKEKAGVEKIRSSYCFYVVREHQSNFDVINAELVKLFLAGQKTSPKFGNFLVAVSNYQGDDIEGFLEDKQGLMPLPEEEELWYVPPPDEPEKPEVEETTVEESPSLQYVAETRHKGSDHDGELHSWPPRSSLQFDGVRKGGQASNTDSTLKMWPPPAPPVPPASPAPPAPVKVGMKEDNNVAVTTQGGHGSVERPNQRIEPPPDQKRISEVVSRAEGAAVNASSGGHVKRAEVNATLVPDSRTAETRNESFVVDVTAQRNDISTTQAEVSVIHLPEDKGDAGSVCPNIVGGQNSHGNNFSPPSFLFYESTPIDLTFEDLQLHGDLKIPEEITSEENPNKERVGRWGEQFVYDFLRNHAKCPLPNEEVEIIWMNEKQNTTAPYDFEIRRHFKGTEDNVSARMLVTYIEVKATSSDKKDSFEISTQELRFALDKRDAFHLYRVFNAGKPSSVRLLRLVNVAHHLEKKNLKLCMVI